MSSVRGNQSAPSNDMPTFVPNGWKIRCFAWIVEYTRACAGITVIDGPSTFQKAEDFRRTAPRG